LQRGTSTQVDQGSLDSVDDHTGGSILSVLDGVAILTVTGQLDFALCLMLAPEFDRAMSYPARAIVIDLEGVSLVDSSGIALLINASRSLDNAGREFAIACPRGPQRRVFELTALDRQLPMHDTREAALAAVGASADHGGGT
jgi:anti-sigma B factor antagonist